MKNAALVAAVVAALATAGCADSLSIDPPAGQKAKISKESMEYFKNSYRPTIGSTHPGAFAVSLSGRNAGYTYCEDIACLSSTSSYGQEAIMLCQRYGEPCYLFATGDHIRVDYDVVE